MPVSTMSSRTPFDVLGVSKSATPDEIQRAYKDLVVRWHPSQHGRDNHIAQRRFDELNRAYGQLMRAAVPESRPEEQYPTNPETNVMGRNPSASSSGSSLSRDSSDFFADDDSIAPTTPATSFKDSPTHTNWPSSPFTTPPYRADHKIPTYQNWRAGPDLPEELRQKPYHPSHPSHLKPPMSGMSNTRRPAAPSFSPPLPNSSGDAAAHPAARRPAISVVLPQPVLNGGRHPMSNSEKQYVNVYGQVATQPSHSAPYDLPLDSIGLGPSGEWTYSLPLTLEQLFSGVHLQYPIVRRLLSGRSRTVTLDIDITAGCRPSSRLFCRRVGNEIKPGVLQDIAFIVEEKPHPRLTRVRDDILLDIRIPWDDSIRQYGAQTEILGIDGQSLSLFIDYPRTKVTKGTSVIKAAGMPIRHGGKVVGRGDLVVEWQIVPEEHQKIRHFVKRLWKK